MMIKDYFNGLRNRNHSMGNKNRNRTIRNRNRNHSMGNKNRNHSIKNRNRSRNYNMGITSFLLLLHSRLLHPTMSNLVKLREIEERLRRCGEKRE